MAIIGGLPLLHCRDIGATLDFYRRAFQFVVVNQREQDGSLQWVHLMHADTSLMLQAQEPAAGGSTRNIAEIRPISLYLFVNNINELHHFIKVNNYDVTNIETRHYHMLEFSVLDPEGNRIVVAQKT